MVFKNTSVDQVFLNTNKSNFNDIKKRYSRTFLICSVWHNAFRYVPLLVQSTHGFQGPSDHKRACLLCKVHVLL